MASELLTGSLPEEWELTTLGAVCERSGGNVQTGPFGSQLHASDYVSVGIPSIMPQNIGDNRVETNGIARVKPEDAERLNRYRVRVGDIVYSRRGDVEKRALIRAEESGWLCGTGCLRVRFGDDDVDPLFAFYYLGHPEVRAWIVRHAIGATMPNLNTSILSSLPFVIPPRFEQQAISYILGTLDDKIELNRRMNETLETIARALFKSWFVDFDPVRAKADNRRPAGMDAETAALFPSAFVESQVGQIPKGWTLATLSDLANVSSGKRPNERQAESSEKMKVPLFGGGGLMAYVEEPLITEPVLLTGRVGTLGEIFRLTSPFWASDNTLVIKPKKEYLYAYVYFQLHFVDFDSLNRGSTQPLITQGDLSKLAMLLPDIAILENFHKQVSSLFSRFDLNRDESRTLAALRDALLPKLLSGEIRVREADREVEQVA